MGTVFSLTVRQLSGKWRLVIMAVLSLLPVVFTALVLSDDGTPFVDEFEVVVLSAMLAGSIVPLIVVAIASVAFGNEVEDRTLANLTLSPLPRWQIVVPKLAASVAVAAPFVLGSAFFTSLLAFNRDWLAAGAVTTATFVGLLLYSSAFLWLGLVTRQAIAVGLAYIVLWEGFFSGFVSGIRFLSIRHYATAWMHGIDPRRFAAEPHVGLGVAVVVSVAVFAVFVVLSTRSLRRMDVP
ncbi:MAG: ABC transporter permease subunit [Longimicrobiales bacterium]